MAFIKKEWKDRMAEFAGRRRLINVDTGAEQVVDASREEGLFTQAEYNALGNAKQDSVIYCILEEL